MDLAERRKFTKNDHLFSRSFLRSAGVAAKGKRSCATRRGSRSTASLRLLEFADRRALESELASLRQRLKRNVVPEEHRYLGAIREQLAKKWLSITNGSSRVYDSLNHSVANSLIEDRAQEDSNLRPSD
jgi:hypothetical protein